jgi:hypothetical protein
MRPLSDTSSTCPVSGMSTYDLLSGSKHASRAEANAPIAVNSLAARPLSAANRMIASISLSPVSSATAKVRVPW